MVRYFQAALGDRGRVLATDANANAPALHEADAAFVVPSIYHERYIDTLVDLCRDEGVTLLFSLNDLELPILAEAKTRLAEVGTTVVVSSPEVIDICFDKLETKRFLERHGFRTIRTYTSLEETVRALDRGDLSLPLVLKPRWGSGSIGVEFVEDREELELAYRLLRRRLARTVLSQVSSKDLDRAILLQETIQGVEYGLDVINDLQGEYVVTVAKRKLKLRGGEADISQVVDDEAFAELGRDLSRHLGHIGNLDCDVFVNDSGLWLVEMNPRFGGGYPFSHVAGIDLPAAFVAWARGEAPNSDWLTPKTGVASARCERLVVLDKVLSYRYDLAPQPK